MKCANFNKIKPIAPDKRAHSKASSFLVILFEPPYLKYDRLESSTLFLRRKSEGTLLAP